MRVHRAGIPIAMGTDAGNPLTLHGPAIYAEMEAMQKRGHDPAGRARRGDRGGGRARWGATHEFGTVGPGKRRRPADRRRRSHPRRRQPAPHALGGARRRGALARRAPRRHPAWWARWPRAGAPRAPAGAVARSGGDGPGPAARGGTRFAWLASDLGNLFARNSSGGRASLTRRHRRLQRAFAEFSATRWHERHERTHWTPYICAGAPQHRGHSPTIGRSSCPTVLLDAYDALHRWRAPGRRWRCRCSRIWRECWRSPRWPAGCAGSGPLRDGVGRRGVGA